MRYYIATHEQVAASVQETDLWDAVRLFAGLARAGVFDDSLSFNRFNLIVEQALWQDAFSFDAEATLAQVEAMLTKLGVMPFDEFALPNELTEAS